jgi:5-methylcytosine-specific restriction endonuclease McrA
LGCCVVNPTGGLFQKDHIVPRSKGGTDDPSNLRHLCWFCNSARKDIDAKYDAAIAVAGRAFWSAIQSLRRPLFQ